MVSWLDLFQRTRQLAKLIVFGVSPGPATDNDDNPLGVRVLSMAAFCATEHESRPEQVLLELTNGGRHLVMVLEWYHY
jgi:hypothetical protein